MTSREITSLLFSKIFDQVGLTVEAALVASLFVEFVTVAVHKSVHDVATPGSDCRDARYAAFFPAAFGGYVATGGSLAHPERKPFSRHFLATIYHRVGCWALAIQDIS